MPYCRTACNRIFRLHRVLRIGIRCPQHKEDVMALDWASFVLGVIAGVTLGVLFMALWTVAVYKDEDDTV